MSVAYFEFLDGLDFFLRPNQKQRIVAIRFQGRQSLKHLIESLGVPHTEVGEILVNGQQAESGRIAQDGDQVVVHAAPRGLSIPPRFLLDNHLGRLAAYLRMLGFDCLYQNNFQDNELAHILSRQQRVLLTRDRRLLMRKVVVYGYCLRSLEPVEQLREVIWRFDLKDKISPFQRCLRCNTPLQPVSKEAILERLQPLTKKYFDEFHICPSCQQIYWKGSHYERMQKRIAEFFKS
jgi:uncharacterized protein with PIN domain